MLKKYLTIFLISMVPILELRGAIPYSVGFGLPSIPSFIVCVIGNMIPVPFIYWFARRVLEWGKDKRFIGKFFTWCLVKGEHGGQKLMAKSGTGVYIAFCCSWEYHFREPGRGQEHWQPASLSLTGRKALSWSCWEWSWQE